MSIESQSLVDKDLDYLRRYDPDKFYRVAKDLQEELRTSRNQLEVVKGAPYHTEFSVTSPTSETPLHWPGRSWVPAETSYPNDDFDRFSCLSNGTRAEILLYDCKINKVKVVRGLQEVYNKTALFSKLPSRVAGQLRVCIEQIPPAAARSTPRYRVTEKQVPKDMAFRHEVRLGDISPLTRCKIMLGHIKWIFILNFSDSTEDKRTKGKE